MTTPNPYRYLRACAWGGPIVILVSILFWGLLGRNIPPYSAALDAATLAGEVRANAVAIRIGMTAIVMAGALYMVWTLAISKVMETLETDNDVLSRLQMWGGGLTTVIFIIPPTAWLTATFRAETLDPQLIQLLYDFGWMMFDLTVTVTSVQFISFGVCFLGDRRPQPLMPKWVCWLAIYTAVGFLLLMFMPFFKSGPLSRSGVINYFVEFGLFFLWMLVTAWYLFGALTKLEREHAAKPA